MSRIFRLAALILFVGVVCSIHPRALYADGSLFGTLAGHVKDESGGALPGVVIEVTSVEKGFQRTATTDSAGAFTVALLPPGTYKVTATISGFETYVSTGDVVAPEKTTNVTISLKLAGTKVSVEVTGEAPLVDKTNTSDTTTVRAELTDKLPIGRAYQNAIELAPGLYDTDFQNPGNTTAHGAPDSANLFLFDGIDSTDPTTGTFGANNNFDTVQEVVVSTSSVSAEYGRAQGAIVNVITKSGTNIFHGSGRVLATNDSWNSQNKGTNVDGSSFERNKLDKTAYDYLFTLGGPVWKDHVWFFGAYERNPQAAGESQTIQSPNHPDGTGQSYTPSPTFEAWQGKLNAQVTPSHALTFEAQADPFSGIVRDYWGGAADLRALTSQEQSKDCPWACIWQVRYSGVYGSSLSAELTYAQQRGGITVGAFQGNGSPYINLTDQLAYNGSPFVGSVTRPRNQANAAFNYYATLGGHSHNFKVGVDYQDIKSDSSYTFPNNELFYVTDFDPIAHQPILGVGDLWQQYLPLQASVSTGKIWGIYGLDRFDLSSRLSFNLGVRVDVQNGKSDLRQAVVSATTVSPRVSGSYDIFGDGKTLASAGYGRYYDFLAQSIIDSIFSGVPLESNYDQFVWDGSAWQFDRSIRVGGNNQPVNQDLKPSYVDDFNVGVQQQVGNSMAVGIRGIYRNWNHIVDDVKDVVDGNKLLTPVNFDNSELKRRYKALEVTFDKRFSNNFQALASYTLSKADGNTDRSYALTAFTSQLFDYPNDTCTVDAVGSAPAVSGPCPEVLGHNQFGPLPWDATHVVKLYTAYTLPLPAVNLTFAPVFRYFSGLTFQEQRTFTTPSGDGVVYFDTPRGSSHLRDRYRVDFSLEAALKVLSPVEIALKGDIFNATNQQPVVDPTLIVTTPTEDFGKPASRDALATPRAYQVSAVVRF